ncbi:MAG: response regulator [Clostridiales bacterium]|jgi:two-component system response regulator YesN|nr:response regulator [Clostridiales bacterium]
MRRLLLVDDEPYIVDLLYEMFSQKTDLDLEICKAYTSQEALDWLGRVEIDVVLSDIRMPGMSGLELIGRIRESWPLCRVILLTGYRKFDYIYQAEKYPGVTYLLKTEDDDVILDAVRTQLRAMEEDLRGRSLVEESSAKIELLACNILLGGVAKGRIEWESVSQSDFDAHGLPILVDRPFLLMCGRFCGGGAERIQRLTPVYSLIKMHMSHTYRIAQWSEDGLEIFWIMQPKDNARPESPSQENMNVKVRNLLEDIQQVCLDKLNSAISFVLDSRFAKLSDLKNRVVRLSELSRYRLVSEEPVILTLGNGREEELGEKSLEKLINNIKRYVRSNISSDLSLTEISDKMFYNASYISRVFKHVEGINLSEFVLLERINRACDLLSDSLWTINEISTAVGFKSPQYFATVFKKHTELTPNQYREDTRKYGQNKQK